MNYLKLLKLAKSKPEGFTLLEILFTTVLVGVLAAIAAPSFVRTIELQTLKGSASDVYQAVAQAQNRAMQRKENWQTSFRVNSGILQYAVHQVTQDPGTGAVGNWTSLPKQIQPDAETNIPQLGGIYQICFNEQGLPTQVQVGPPRTCANPPTFTPPVQITLNNTKALGAQRCLIVSTILGAFKTGQDQPSPQGGKNCY